MFSNIGGKIKAVAKIVTWIGIICSVLAGIGTGMAANNVAVGIISGIIVAVVGAVASWIGSLALYGFGQLVENSDICAKKLSEK